jgi:hypothetical protein
MRSLLALLLPLAAALRAAAGPDVAIEVLARTGRPVPGVGEILAGFQWASIDRDGDVVVPACLGRRLYDGDVACHALLRFAKGKATIVARHGDRAPGTRDGVVFRSFAAPVRLDDGGPLFFEARLEGVGIDENLESFWRTDRSGGIQRAEQAALRSDRFGPARLNDAGQALVHDRHRVPDEIWGPRNGEHALLARVDAPAPGVPGARFAGFEIDTRIDAAGRVAFVGHLRKDEAGVTWENGSGLWVSEPSGELRVRLRRGDIVDGVRLHSFALGAMNDVGDVFVCAFADRRDAPEPFVIVHVDERGVRRIVIAPGSKVAVGGSEERTVVRLTAQGCHGTGDFRGARGINDRSEIPVTARLDDGSQVLLVARVPEAELEVEAPRR